MNRTEYLQMCQKVSVLKGGICGTKENVPPCLKVIHEGIAYYPLAYELSFDGKGGAIHKAILHELKSNCIVYAKLEKVSKYE